MRKITELIIKYSEAVKEKKHDHFVIRIPIREIENVEGLPDDLILLRQRDLPMTDEIELMYEILK